MTEFDIEERKDFDLELVLSSLKRCKQNDGTILLDQYLLAFAELCRFFHLTGRLFGFVATDLDSKMNVLVLRREGPEKEYYHSLQSMLDYEISENMTSLKGSLPSGSRTFLRLHRALEFILEFMRRISRSCDDDKVSVIASEVYTKTLSNHHPWITKKMAALAMYFLPSRKHLIETMCKQDYTIVLKMLGEVVQAGHEVYNTSHRLYKEQDLLALP